MKQISSSLVFLLLLVSCGNTDAQKDFSQSEETADKEVSTSVDISSTIPLYSFDELEERYFKTNSDAVLVLNFWATWCKPCVKELPAFEQLAINYKEKDVEVILVSLDFPEHVDKAVVPFIEKNKLRNKVVLLDDPDANTWIPKVSDQWSGAIPATLIINNGEHYFYERSFTYKELENEVQSLL